MLLDWVLVVVEGKVAADKAKPTEKSWLHLFFRAAAGVGVETVGGIDPFVKGCSPHSYDRVCACRRWPVVRKAG